MQAFENNFGFENQILKTIAASACTSKYNFVSVFLTFKSCCWRFARTRLIYESSATVLRLKYKNWVHYKT